jgi:hypothetical protein
MPELLDVEGRAVPLVACGIEDADASADPEVPTAEGLAVPLVPTAVASDEVDAGAGAGMPACDDVSRESVAV